MAENWNVVNLKDDLMSLYRQNTGDIQAGSGRLLNSHREQALLRFDMLGIPTMRNENYKYTPLEKYLQGNYDVEFVSNPFQINLSEVFKCDIPELDTDVVLMLNGFYYRGNRPESLPDGVIVCSLKEASELHPVLFSEHYARYADDSADGLVALNTLFAQDGVFIYIPPGIQLARPLQIINLGHSPRNLRVTRRNLIIAGSGSSASVVVCDHTLCNQSYLTNSLTEIYVGKNARVDYHRMQNENSLSVQINNLFVYQAEQSSFHSSCISLHGGLIRNNIFAKLDGPNAETNLYGLFLCDEEQHVANYLLVDHARPDCTSNQLFKGILDGNSTGAFNGRIFVRPDAQKTRAYQKNNNMLLSATSRMNTKPHLEIYADDVKCSHGATVGQIDQDALFYLRARGIPYKEAKHLLMYAFANEIVSHISIPILKDRIMELVDKRLRGELSRCHNCSLRCN